MDYLIWITILALPNQLHCGDNLGGYKHINLLVHNITLCMRDCLYLDGILYSALKQKFRWGGLCER